MSMTLGQKMEVNKVLFADPDVSQETGLELLYLAAKQAAYAGIYRVKQASLRRKYRRQQMQIRKELRMAIKDQIHSV